MSVIPVPSNIARFEQEIKKSRFIAYAAPAASVIAAQDYVAQLRVEYPDARHICSAFVIGPEGADRQTGQSDDGEPGGTAGLPMLNVLQHSGLSDIVAVVIRYFGGIKLGKGGLARAYSSSVSEVLKIIPVVEKIPTTSITFCTDYALEDQLRRYLKSLAVENLTIEYDEQIRIACDVPLDRMTELTETLSDLSRGQINLGPTDSCPS